MRRQIFTLFAAVSMITTIAACAGDDAATPSPTSSNAPTNTPVVIRTVAATPVTTHEATPSAAPTTTPDGRRSGIPAVDAAIDAEIAGDASAIRSMLRFTSIGCIVEPQGIGAPPLCRPGEADGTRVDVLPSATCEGEYVRPDNILDQSLTTDGARLYAVYRTNAGTFPSGTYAVIFLRQPNPEGIPTETAFALMMDDDAITGIKYGCGESPQQFVQSQHLTDEIVPRQGTPEP